MRQAAWVLTESAWAGGHDLTLWRRADGPECRCICRGWWRAPYCLRYWETQIVKTTLNNYGTLVAKKTISSAFSLIVPDQKTFRAPSTQTQWSTRSGVPNRGYSMRFCHYDCSSLVIFPGTRSVTRVPVPALPGYPGSGTGTRVIFQFFYCFGFFWCSWFLRGARRAICNLRELFHVIITDVQF